MKNSLTTFERDVRERLLDVVAGQWHDLGVPFSAAPAPNSAEVIDPEALLWCSLEFFPTDPRLREGVVAWLHTYRNCIIRQRVNRLAKAGEPRTSIWQALLGWKNQRSEPPGEPCYGLASATDVTKFCETLSSYRNRLVHGDFKGRTGAPSEGASTAILRARDLLGSDLRHLLLVYLLASHGGERLRTIERWSGYSYRSLSETATRWQTAKVLDIDHGYCHLGSVQPWLALLRHKTQGAVIVDWLRVFDAYVHLLRALAKAGRKDLSLDSPVVDSYCRETDKALSSAVLVGKQDEAPSVSHLHEPILHRAGTASIASARRSPG